MVNRGSSTPRRPPAHLATTLDALPASSRAAAAHTVDLTITTPGHVVNVAAMVLPHDLAVTTTHIPANALITGSTATKVELPRDTRVGRDKVMGFSIVQLGDHGRRVEARHRCPRAPRSRCRSDREGFDQGARVRLGRRRRSAIPRNDAQGVVQVPRDQVRHEPLRYVDAIAVDHSGHVVARALGASLLVPGAVRRPGSRRRRDRSRLSRRPRHRRHGRAGWGRARHEGRALQRRRARGPRRRATSSPCGTASDLDTWDQLVSTLYLTPGLHRRAYHVLRQDDRAPRGRDARVSL